MFCRNDGDSIMIRGKKDGLKKDIVKEVDIYLIFMENMVYL